MNKRSLLQKIKANFPELNWNVAEHNVEGWDHYVIILDGKYVFRFPRADKYIKALNNEISLLKYLKEKSNVSVPDYAYIAKDKSFAGYELIEGDQLKKKIFKALPETAKDIIAKKIAEFLSILHKTPSTIYSKYVIKDSNDRAKYSNLVRKINKYIRPKFSKKDQILVDSYLKEFKKYLKFPKKVLTHNDLYSSHILISKDKKSISGIIDFSDRREDDPAIDFCELWGYGREFVLEVYKHYKGPKDKDFLKRSIMYYKRIPFWEMISSSEGGRGKFKKGIEMFKWRFVANNIEI